MGLNRINTIEVVVFENKENFYEIRGVAVVVETGGINYNATSSRPCITRK